MEGMFEALLGLGPRECAWDRPLELRPCPAVRHPTSERHFASEDFPRFHAATRAGACWGATADAAPPPAPSGDEALAQLCGLCPEADIEVLSVILLDSNNDVEAAHKSYQQAMKEEMKQSPPLPTPIPLAGAAAAPAAPTTPTLPIPIPLPSMDHSRMSFSNSFTPSWGGWGSPVLMSGDEEEEGAMDSPTLAINNTSKNNGLDNNSKASSHSNTSLASMADADTSPTCAASERFGWLFPGGGAKPSDISTGASLTTNSVSIVKGGGTGVGIDATAPVASPTGSLVGSPSTDMAGSGPLQAVARHPVNEASRAAANEAFVEGRKLVKELFDAADATWQASIDAKRQGRLQEAARLEKESRELRAQAHAAKAEARESSFQRTNNFNGGDGGGVMRMPQRDLHNQTVADAVALVDRILRKAQAFVDDGDYEGVAVPFVTGRGMHSADGVPKVRQAVEQYMEAHGVSYRLENASGLLVALLGSAAAAAAAAAV